jgi:hypothetical protein
MSGIGVRKIDYSAFGVWPELPEQAIHTPEHPFCFDMTCYCHQDQELIAQTAQDVEDGLLSYAEADRIYRGRMV